MNHGSALNMPPLDSPTWRVAVAKLASIITRPMHVASVCLAAQTDWGWEHTFTINVLAAGEDTSFVSKTDGTWWRVEGAAVDANAKVNGQVIGYGVNFKACKQCQVDFVPRSPRQVFCHQNCRQLKWKRTKMGAAA